MMEQSAQIQREINRNTLALIESTNEKIDIVKQYTDTLSDHILELQRKYDMLIGVKNGE